MTWVADDGILYLNPEITLLYKAALDRSKDRCDLAVAWPLLSAEQRSWLIVALETVHPGHAWLELVTSDGWNAMRSSFLAGSQTPSGLAPRRRS